MTPVQRERALRLLTAVHAELTPSLWNIGILTSLQDSAEYKDLLATRRELEGLIDTIKQICESAADNSDDIVESDIREFFEQRFYRIKDTSVCLLNNGACTTNKVLWKLAEDLTTEVEGSRCIQTNKVRLLMPTVTSIDDTPEAANVMGDTWQDSTPIAGQFIFSDDGTRLIPVLDSLTMNEELVTDEQKRAWRPEYVSGYNGAVGMQKTQLSEGERNRVKGHTEESRYLYEALDAIWNGRRIREENLRDSLSQLATRFNNVSIYTEAGRRAGARDGHAADGEYGQLPEGSESATDVVLDFNRFLTRLKERSIDDYTRLMSSSINGSDGGANNTFASIKTQVARGNCAGMIHNAIYAFIHNPHNAEFLGSAPAYDVALKKARECYAGIEQYPEQQRVKKPIDGDLMLRDIDASDYYWLLIFNQDLAQQLFDNIDVDDRELKSKLEDSVIANILFVIFFTVNFIKNLSINTVKSLYLSLDLAALLGAVTTYLLYNNTLSAVLINLIAQYGLHVFMPVDLMIFLVAISTVAIFKVIIDFVFRMILSYIDDAEAEEIHDCIIWGFNILMHGISLAVLFFSFFAFMIYLILPLSIALILVLGEIAAAVIAILIAFFMPALLMISPIAVLFILYDEDDIDQLYRDFFELQVPFLFSSQSYFMPLMTMLSVIMLSLGSCLESSAFVASVGKLILTSVYGSAAQSLAFAAYFSVGFWVPTCSVVILGLALNYLHDTFTPGLAPRLVNAVTNVVTAPVNFAYQGVRTMFAPATPLADDAEQRVRRQQQVAQAAPGEDGAAEEIGLPQPLRVVANLS